MKNCDVEGCDRRHYAKGYCAMHWRRTRQTGEPGRAAPHRLFRPVRMCSVEGCERKYYCKELCHPHYERLRSKGTLNLAKPLGILGNPEKRFWLKVDKNGPGGCWLWTSTLIKGGYGRFGLNGRHVLAHRYSYELNVGPIPEGMEIDHVYDRGCRHRNCVNPAHLEPVTKDENIRRMIAAQRATA